MFIAKRYPFLIEERDQSSITALQYLACNPTAFRRGKRQIRRGFIEQLSKSKIEARRGSMGEVFMGSLILLCIVPFNSFIIIIYSSFTQLSFLAFLFKSQNFVEIGYVVMSFWNTRYAFMYSIFLKKLV